MYTVVVFIFIPVVRPLQGREEEKEVGDQGRRGNKGGWGATKGKVG